jgi:hypothetical protein
VAHYIPIGRYVQASGEQLRWRPSSSALPDDNARCALGAHDLVVHRLEDTARTSGDGSAAGRAHDSLIVGLLDLLDRAEGGVCTTADTS